MTDAQKLALIRATALQYMGSLPPQSDPEFIAEFLRKAHARIGWTVADVQGLAS